VSPRFHVTRRPLIDLALVAAVVGLLVAAYAIADWPWPVEFAPRPATTVQTVVTAPANLGPVAAVLHRTAVSVPDSGRT